MNNYRCSCGRTYTKAEWNRLRRPGFMPDYDGNTLELRDCKCGSTRAQVYCLEREFDQMRREQAVAR